MISIRTDEEVDLIRQSNLLVAATLAHIAVLLKPGVSTLEVDKKAEQFIRDNGGVPGFKGYNGFPFTLCISINDEVVHGMPSDRTIIEGDLVSVDCGVYMNGYHGDSAYTFLIEPVTDQARDLARITREALYQGIAQAIDGNRLGNLSHAVQTHAEAAGFSVVREMVGHGVGRELHEPPEVPNWGRQGTGVILKTGMVLAIEPMINLGRRYIVQDPDGWTIRTSDRQLSAHYEHTVVVGKSSADILSDFTVIDDALRFS